LRSAALVFFDRSALCAVLLWSLRALRWSSLVASRFALRDVLRRKEGTISLLSRHLPFSSQARLGTVPGYYQPSRCAGLDSDAANGLESSGADSSGLTEAALEILCSVDVRLSEWRVVVLALYLVGAVCQRETVWAFQIVLCPVRRATLIETPSLPTCHPESRRRALVSRTVRDRLRWSLGTIKLRISEFSA